MKNLKLFLVVLVGALGLVTLFSANKAEALTYTPTDTFPRDGDSMLFITKYQSPGRNLQTPDSQLNIFFKEKSNYTANTSFTISVDVICRGGGGDPGGHLTLIGNNAVNVVSQKSWNWSSHCTPGVVHDSPDYTITQSIKWGQLRSDPDVYGDNYRYATLKLDVDNDNAGIGAIVRASDNGKVTFREMVYDYSGCDDNDPPRCGNSDNYTGHGTGAQKGTYSAFREFRTAFAILPRFGKADYGFTFAASCNYIGAAPFPTYLRWYDADWGESNQSESGYNFDLVDKGTDGNGNNIILNNYNDNLGGNDSYREKRITIIPGHQYRWVWHGVDQANGVQFWIPFSEIFASGDDTCKPQEAASCNTWASNGTVAPGDSVDVMVSVENVGSGQWPSTVTVDGPGSNNHDPGRLNPGGSRTYTDTYTRGSPGDVTYTYRVKDGSKTLTTCSTIVHWRAGNAPDGSCTVLSVSDANPFVGQTVTFNVRFKNESTVNDWVVGENSQHSGVYVFGSNPALWPRGVNPPSSQPDPPRPYPLAGGGGDRLRVGATARRLFTLGGPSTAGPATYNFAIRKDNTNTYFSNDHLCSYTITWRSLATITPSCTYINVSNPGNVSYGLRITNRNTGQVVVDTKNGPVQLPAAFKDPNPPNPFGPPWDTFNQFNQVLYPHYSYTFTIFDWNDPGRIFDSKNLGQCMTASCTSFSTQPTAKVEPGQSFTLSYGVALTNNTLRTFPAGTYGVAIGLSGGLSSSSTASNGAFTAGTITNFIGPYPVTANFGGAVKANLIFQNTNINNYFTGLPCSSAYNPETRPYLKVNWGDLSAGGGFETTNADGSVSACRYDDDPNYIAPVPRANSFAGGVLTFANTSTYASSADFAVYALGLIEGSPTDGNSYGVYSNAARPFAGNVATWTFANTTASAAYPLAGLLIGNNTPAHCATDYFHATAKVSNPTFEIVSDIKINPGADGLGATSYDGQYYVKPAGSYVEIRNGAGQVGRGDRITIYVDGNVYISKNITYQNWGFDLSSKSNDAPYLTIIARGNISVAPNVTELDGLYIAQPDSAGNRGAFISCSLDGINPANADQVTSSCRDNALTVNGAVIAQHVYPLRSIGTLVNGAGHAAENFTYAPSIIMGQPNFKSNSGVVVPGGPLDSLFALPPVF